MPEPRTRRQAMIAAVKITDTLPAGADEKKQAGSRPRKRMNQSQMKEYLAKKMRELEMAQAAITIYEQAVDMFHCEYERLQDYFLTVADRQLLEVQADYGTNLPKLETLRTAAQTIANRCLPHGLEWDWKWHLRAMVEGESLPPIYSTIYKLEEVEKITRR